MQSVSTGSEASHQLCIWWPRHREETQDGGFQFLGSRDKIVAELSGAFETIHMMTKEDLKIRFDGVKRGGDQEGPGVWKCIPVLGNKH